MKEIFKQSFAFIKKNPRIVYTLALVFFIPAAIFVNTFFIIDRFQRNIDHFFRLEGDLVGNIIGYSLSGSDTNEKNLSENLLKIKQANEEIEFIKVLVFDKEKEDFRIVASTEDPEDKQEILDFQKKQFSFAWQDPRGIASLGANEKGRFWRVIKLYSNEKGEKQGLIWLSLSLRDFDNLVDKTIRASYIILALTIIFVLFLVANNAKLFGYALALSRLKEIDKMKDTFISMASHELKAPLVSLKGNIEFFREETESHLNEEGRKYLNNIASSVERLEMLVQDILEVSRLEGNRMPISVAVVEAGEIIEKSIEEIKPQAIKKEIPILYSPKPLPKVKTDPERAKQILINLLSNAVKYTLKGKVEVIVEESEKELLITVADTGVGISAENLKNLFQKFSRIYNKETREVSGTGLGLWISRELAKKMGGDITVESIRGVGSHFTLHLPLAK